MDHKAESRAIPDKHNAYFKGMECNTHGTSHAVMSLFLLFLLLFLFLSLFKVSQSCCSCSCCGLCCFSVVATAIIVAAVVLLTEFEDKNIAWHS